LFFGAPTALWLQLHSGAMRPQPRLVGAQNPVATLRHFISYKVLVMSCLHFIKEMSLCSVVKKIYLKKHGPAVSAGPCENDERFSSLSDNQG